MPKKRRIPLRMCIGCGERRPKQELVRIVRTPDGEVVVDRTGKRSGRGAYVCGDRDCFSGSVNRARLARALECEITPDDIERLKQELSR